MKTTVHLDSLRLTVRGVPVATAAAAVRGLGSALTDELATDAAKPSPASDLVRVSPSVSIPSLRSALASRVAGALRPHLPSKQR